MYVMSLINDMRRRKAEGSSKKDGPYDEERTQMLKREGAASHTPQQAATAAAAVAGAPSLAAIQARCRPQLGWAVGVVFLLLPFLQAYVQPPEIFWKALLAASLLFLGYHVMTFKRWADEFPYVLRFLVCFAAMIVELLSENVMVWIVSATDMRKYDDPPGLQDNAEIALNFLAGKHALLGWFIYGKWANIMHFLGCVLCLAFSVAWEQHPYSGFGVMARFSLTICFSRILRTASFMCTVLPSPRPGCYRRRFPPPPDSVSGIIWVGIRELRGFGGCNDLIFSGHGAFWSLGPLMFQTYYPNKFSTALLWIALVQTSIRDVIDKQHYSVDMFLAVVVTWAVWSWLRWVYPEGQLLPQRPEGAAADKPNALVLTLVGVGLLTAAVAVFVAKS
ncbi:hypothetical protein OEZ85_014019 [Tetradesmus obliquus]|uniref:Sphingomyelin synthase-like domain-containing protein n=1 Tax=Tetradesmus obliquus TaxID=3088 RepID=A0ABY8U6M7_TETOB|nr:hypothetical protein OEZ85_014019 [Tetradesmus obliquus]